MQYAVKQVTRKPFGMFLNCCHRAMLSQNRRSYKINNGVIESELAAKSTRQPNKQVLEYIRTLSPEAVVLDYGCGKFRYTIPLSIQVKKVVAIDSLEQLSKRQIIAGRAMTLLEYQNNKVSICTIDSGKWRDTKYDAVICTNVLSAIPNTNQKYFSRRV